MMENYRFTKQHEWILNSDEGAVIGITDHAQEQLGDIVYVELPEVGDSFDEEAEFGSLESVKAVAEVYMPVNGEVIEINELLEDHPEMVNKNPFESGWLIKIKLEDASVLDDMMNHDEYKEYVASESE